MRSALAFAPAFAPAFALTLGACRHATAPAEPGTGSSAILAIGQAFDPPNAALHISFARVANDSRCPSDGVCVWAGNAEVVITVSIRGSSTPAATWSLNSSVGAREVVVTGYRIRLERLDPWPVSGTPQEPSAYRATLSVTFLPD